MECAESLTFRRCFLWDHHQQQQTLVTPISCASFKNPTRTKILMRAIRLHQVLLSKQTKPKVGFVFLTLLLPNRSSQGITRCKTAVARDESLEFIYSQPVVGRPPYLLLVQVESYYTKASRIARLASSRP